MAAANDALQFNNLLNNQGAVVSRAAGLRFDGMRQPGLLLLLLPLLSAAITSNYCCTIPTQPGALANVQPQPGANLEFQNLLFNMDAIMVSTGARK